MRSKSEMNIIRMAREVGAGEPESLYGRTDYVVMTKHELERFAALVAAAALAEDAMQRLTDVQQEMEATSQESRQVKPMHPEIRKMWEDYFDKCFAAPPKRTPLTDEEMGVALGFGEYTTASTKATLLNISRSIERAHGIGGEE